MVSWLVLLLLLLLLFWSGINHRFVSVSLGLSIRILLSFYTCTLPLLKTTVQSVLYNTGTDISDRSISLNLCAFFVSAGSFDDSCNYLAVTESIVFVLATPTLVSS